MKVCSKINLGLNVISRRADGYHNLETVFLPIPLYDELTITPPADEGTFASSETGCRLTVTGDSVECEEQQNLVVKAYNLLAEDFRLPRLHVTLDKHIPSQAGLGGGSSDAAHMIKLLNEHCALGLSTEQMEQYAAKLGADCALFIKSQPAYAEGIGDKLYTIPGIYKQVEGLRMVVVKPDVAVSTREAYSLITPHLPKENCLRAVMQPIEAWRNTLVNDFEESIFALHSELAEIKQALYRLGAVYASMSGSGSALYAFFRQGSAPNRRQIKQLFPDCYTAVFNL